MNMVNIVAYQHVCMLCYIYIYKNIHSLNNWSLNCDITVSQVAFWLESIITKIKMVPSLQDDSSVTAGPQHTETGEILGVSFWKCSLIISGVMVVSRYFIFISAPLLVDEACDCPPVVSDTGRRVILRQSRWFWKPWRQCTDRTNPLWLLLLCVGCTTTQNWRYLLCIDSCSDKRFFCEVFLSIQYASY